MSCDVLLVSAFRPELAPLRPALGDALAAELHGRRVMAKAVGIGIPGAAVGLASRLEAIRPRACVFVGTCGVYPPAVDPLGAVVIARRVRLVEPAVLEGRAAFPDPMSTAADCDAALVAGLAATGARAVDVATTLAITTDDALARFIGEKSGCPAEHLEAYSVALACASFGVPFAAALGVANVVGSSAREQWRTHHRSASDAAARVVLAWLGA